VILSTLPGAVLAGAVLGLGLFVAVVAVVGLPERPAGRPGRAPVGRRLEGGTKRLAWGFGVGFVVLLATGWVVAGVALGLLAAYWDRIAGSSADEKRSVMRLEALATWTESLRDTIAGAIGLEQAIPATAATAGSSIRPSLNLLVDRLRIREPLPAALHAFADDLDDPSADVVCASLILNARLRGPGLRDVLTALAVSIREELDMRRRIEASRKAIRRSVRIVLTIVLGVMGLLSVFNEQYVAPYDTIAGQLALSVVALLFLGGLLWLRKLATPARTERFLVREPAVPAPERTAAA
jgi:Flp pilus assembly protein TadB